MRALITMGLSLHPTRSTINRLRVTRKDWKVEPIVNLFRLCLVCVLWTTVALGQLVTQNPLDELRAQVGGVLADAGVPFTPEQERQIALLLEEQRQSSESLFGEIMDFSSGIPEGDQRDRALAGIQWINDEFRAVLPDYLRADQREVWEEFESSAALIGVGIDDDDRSQTNRIQEIRVVNNPLTAENSAGGGTGPGSLRQSTEVIERGGTGAFHGNFSAAFQDDVLNARNPAAENKPPYHERTISGNISGPVIRDRLTVSFSLRNNRRENVGTVKAETLDGPFALGITRPNVGKFYEGRGILQFTDTQSLHFGVEHRSFSRENQGIGNFTLPERGSDSRSKDYEVDLRHIAVLSDRAVYETRFSWQQEHSETTPLTIGPGVNVLAAFNGGGGQNRSESDATDFGFGNLLYFTDGRLTLRAGTEGTYRREREVDEDNFLGLYTFSDLENYRNRTPSQYDVNRGDPVLDVNHFQIAAFVQNDLRLTNRLTLMLGFRYQGQNNVDGNHAMDPRLNIAYAAGSSTVIRAGIGTIHEPWTIRDQKRLLRFDGQRQFGLRVSQPGWPDPFQSGDIVTIPPRSRRIATSDMRTPYYVTTVIALERSLPGNLQINFSVDHNRGVNLKRRRNINTPFPGSITPENPDGIKPFPNEGDIIEERTAGLSSHTNYRISLRQRFSIFNIVANYVGNRGYSDGNMLSNAYDLFWDWGRAGSQENHTFTASINSRLPRDVYLTTSFSANSGEIYNITTGMDDNKDGQFSDRPEGVRRNSETGPRFFAVGFNVSKAFQLNWGPGGGGSGTQISLFANIDNAFNMTNLEAPVGVMTSRNFGLSTSAFAPREIEVGLRYQF